MDNVQKQNICSRLKFKQYFSVYISSPGSLLTILQYDSVYVDSDDKILELAGGDKNLQSGQPVFRPKFEPRTFRIEV
jgi:hypothetical protein